MLLQFSSSGKWDSESIKNKLNGIELSPPEALQKIKEFQVATTAKDCSIMITITRRIPSSKFPFVLHGNEEFSYSLSVLDLDPKPLRKMDHYIQLDQQIVQHFLNRKNVN